MKIEYIKGFIGNRYDNNGETLIELNEGLLEPKYKKLHDSILKHELDHTSNNKPNKNDFIHDLNETKVSTRDLLSFMLRHPNSLKQFLPFYFNKKHGFVIDYSLCSVYLVCIFIIGTAVFFALRI